MLIGNLFLVVAPPDWSALGVAVVNALVPILTVIFVWAAKLSIDRLPRMSLPILAVIVGTLVDYIASLVMGGGWNPFISALLGAAAVWLREFVNTIVEHGVNP